ncbi:MerR family transcriptional regulator [Mycobacterium avium subsp. hominissuis]
MDPVNDLELTLSQVRTRESPMLTIGEVARRSGVAATTLRYYEQIGLLPAPIRLGGQRRYDEAVLSRLEVIALCKTAGFALDEIQRLFADDAPGRPASRALARAKLAQIDAQLESLTRARAVIEWGMRCTCPSIDACTCGIHPTRPAPVGPDVRSARRF